MAIRNLLTQGLPCHQNHKRPKRNTRAAIQKHGTYGTYRLNINICNGMEMLSRYEHLELEDHLLICVCEAETTDVQML